MGDFNAQSHIFYHFFDHNKYSYSYTPLCVVAGVVAPPPLRCLPHTGPPLPGGGKEAACHDEDYGSGAAGIRAAQEGHGAVGVFFLEFFVFGKCWKFEIQI